MRYALALALLLFAVGCAAVGPSLADQLEDAEELSGPVFYLGDEFEGLPLADVQLDSDNINAADFSYGDCEPPGEAPDPGGCPVPLDVRNVVCREGTRVFINSTSPERARRATRHLQQVGGGDAEPFEIKAAETTPLCGL